MNSSIKRLLGAILLIGTLGVSSIMAVRATAATPVAFKQPPMSSTLTELCEERVTEGQAHG